jgi:hypothetical protein
MDIGKKQEERVVEPIENPMPEREPVPITPDSPGLDPVPIENAPVPEIEKVGALAWLAEVRDLDGAPIYDGRDGSLESTTEPYIDDWDGAA